MNLRMSTGRSNSGSGPLRLSLRGIAASCYVDLMKPLARFTTVALAAVVVFLALPNQPAAAQQSYRPAFEKFTLPNGLQCVLHRDTTLPLVSVNMTYRAGSARDGKGRSGLALLTGNLFMIATPRFPTDSLAALQRMHRAASSVLTTVDWTSVYSTWPSDQLALALDIEADRLLGGVRHVSPDILKRASALLVRQRKMEVSDPYADIDEALYRETYPAGHPYRTVTSGDTSDLQRLTVKDVQAHASKYFVPANASLTIGGRIDPVRVRQLVERLFGSLPAGAAAQWPKTKPLPPLGVVSLIKEAPINDARLVILFQTVPFTHPDQPLLTLAAKVLAGSDFAALVEGVAGRVPGVQRIEAVQNAQELDGTFMVSVVASPETSLQDVYKAVLQVLRSIGRTGVTDEALQSARNRAEMEFLTPLETLHGEGGRCDVLNLGNVYTGNPAFSFDMLRSHAAATKTGVRDAIRKYLDPGNHVVLSVVAPMRRRQAVTIK